MVKNKLILKIVRTTFWMINIKNPGLNKSNTEKKLYKNFLFATLAIPQQKM